MRENIKRLSKFLFTILYAIYFLLAPSFSVMALEKEPEKGDIENVEPIVNGEGEGQINISKTVTRNDADPEGVFTVTFNIQGNKNSSTTTHPLYTVFVLDASGSMEGTPWRNAKASAIKFSTTLTKNIENSSGETVPTINRVALVTFSGDVLKKKGFSSSAFTSDDIGTYDNMTNYDAGLTAAYELLNDSSIPSDAIKNVIFISDGEPNEGYYFLNGKRYVSDDGLSYLNGTGSLSEYYESNGTRHCAGSSFFGFCESKSYTRNNTLENLKGLLTGEKDNIYSISYNLTGWSNADNRARLAAIATNGHYINTDSNNLDNELTSIAQDISYSAAGIDATLTDELGSDFTISTSGDFTVVDESELNFHLDEIPEEGVSKSFKIKINDYATTGWHETNDGFELKYKKTAQDTEYTTIKSSNNPKVYWVADRSKVTANYYLDGTTTSIADSVTTESDVVDSNGNRIKYETEAKDIYGYSLVETPENAKGFYTLDDTVVNYYYTKNDAEIKNPTLEKSGDNEQIVKKVNDKFNYNISYSTSVDNYVGEVELKLVDQLPYAIDLEASDLGKNDYVYDENAKTITWTINKNISKQDKNISFNRDIKLVYKGINSANLTNEITATIEKSSISDTHNNIVKGSNVDVMHIDADTKEVLFEDHLGEKFAGASYETSAKNIYGYTVKSSTPENYKGEYKADDILVTYEYIRNVGEIKENSESITKSADQLLKNINGSVEYKVNYQAEVINYVGTATTIIKDSPVYRVDTTKTIFNDGASYDETTNTITWTVTSNIDEDHRVIQFDKTFNIYFIIDEENFDGTIVNNVSGLTTYDNAPADFKPNEVTASASTNVAKSKITVKYVDENNTEIAAATVTDNYVGKTLDTKAKDIYGYTLKEGTPSEVTATYEEKDTEVVYVYTKNDGNITNSEVTKVGDTEAIAKNETFEYTLTYKKTIEGFVGTAKTKIVDTLPYEIIELDSDIQGGKYDALNKTITWEFETDLDENNQDIEFVKTIKVKFKDFNANTIKNQLHGETTYDENKTEDDTDTTTEIAKSNITAKYVDENDKELADSVKTTGLVGNEEEFTAKDIYGYTLKDGEDKTKKVVYDKEDKTIKFVYTKNDGVIEEETSKISKQKEGNKNDGFEYTITYEATLDDYIGAISATIVDNLPYEIDEKKSDIQGGEYDAKAKTITWIIEKEVNENDKNINFSKNITLYYKNITSDEVVNNLNVKTSYGSLTSNTEDDAIVKVSKGKVIVHYITLDGKKIADDEVLEGFVGDAYSVTNKDFSLYYLEETKGNTTGKFTNEDIEVTFIYDLSGMGDGEPEEILPPQTGIGLNYSIMFVKYTIALLVIIIAKKNYMLHN